MSNRQDSRTVLSGKTRQQTTIVCKLLTVVKVRVIIIIILM